MRANKQIWRMAEWIHENIYKPRHSVPLDWQSQIHRERMYDKAKQLQYMMLYNAFTGPDNHEN